VQISYDQLVEAVVRAVMAELSRRGVDVTGVPTGGTLRGVSRNAASVEMDFSEYKTPVLAERQVRAVVRGTAEIVVPPGTICTEGAKDLMQKRKIALKVKSPSH
jgi:hypothetical protein